MSNSFLNMILPIILFIIVIGGLIYFLFIRKPSRQSLAEPSQIRQNRQAYNDTQCCICLADPKVLEVSTTCGHSYCGSCIVGLHDHSHQKIKCPLCRNDINILFKVFRDREPRMQVVLVEEKVRQYNRKYGDDNRSVWRRIKQFPFILRTLSGRLLNVEFVRFFFSSANIARMVFTIIAYFISPIDVLPEMLLGVAGYLDDFAMLFLVVGYTIANSAVQFIRRRDA